MLGLTLIDLAITVNTTKGVFSTSIPFKKGLNIIRAGNTSGKSTTVNAIAYAMGLEAILGPRGRRPFPRSMYEFIEDSKANKKQYHVEGSLVALSVENAAGIPATFYRDISGYEDKITVDCQSTQKDYYLKSAGKIGSSNSERGFHYWFESYIGWKLPNVVNFDGSSAKLYLECIFPLFFIEQKRGWSEIQANTPQWGIKNVKQAAVQFCLDIDNFDYDKKLSEAKHAIASAEDSWEKLTDNAQNIAKYNGVKLSRISELGEKDGNFTIRFLYPQNESWISLYNRQLSLTNRLDQLSETPDDQLLNDDKLQEQFSTVQSLRRKHTFLSNSIESTLLALKDTETKLETISQELLEYQQLKRLRQVGSDISADLNTDVCPICETALYDSLSKSKSRRRPMTLEENIEFLKNQQGFYKSIFTRHQASLSQQNAELTLIKSTLDEQNRILKSMRDDADHIQGEERNKLRKRLEIENKLEAANKLVTTQTELSEEAKKIFADWSKAKGARKSLQEKTGSGRQAKTIKQLQAALRTYLEEFEFVSSPVHHVSISTRTFRPEQDGYDIVAESSASDYIRIIWSYTLALLELASKNESMKHAGFIVLDEPRQQEADLLSFTALIEQTSLAAEYGGQVIFATSLDEERLLRACEGNDVNLISFDDYVFALEGDDSEEPPTSFDHGELPDGEDGLTGEV